MIKGLAGATIWSSNLENLLPFYRDVLGLKIRVNTPGFVVFGDPDTAALALGTHSEVHGRNTDRRATCGPPDRRRGRRLGPPGRRRVEFVERATDYGDFRIATVKDPEGNLIQLLQPIGR